VDLDGDGIKDILSGSWPGEIFLFRGRDGGSFDEPIMIQDKNGEYINIGGGIDETEDRILIIGNADFERTPEGTFVNYHGKRLKSTQEKPISITGTASAVRAADWDGDGDLDLIVGDIRGSVHLIPNEGSRKSYRFGKELPLQAKGRPVRVIGNAGPCTADWDGDGDLDLLVGSSDGSVVLYRNVGKSASPELAAAIKLVPAGKGQYGENAPKEPSRGRRSKVCVADWNGDGRLDLLLGDLATLKPDRPDPTPEQAAEYEMILKELETIGKEYSSLNSKVYGSSKIKDKAELEKVKEKLQVIRHEMSALSAKLPCEYENHGWIWLFLRE